MNDKQKKWEEDLAQNRGILQVKIHTLLTGLVKELSEKKPPLAIESGGSDTFSSPPQRAEAAVQTENDSRTDENMSMVSSSPNGASQDRSHIILGVASQPLPRGEEALRAELASVSAQLVSKTSSARSLQNSMVELRSAMIDICDERERLNVQIRHLQSREITWKEMENRLVSDLARAGHEVDWLRRSIIDFHKPTSRIYQSVKDAVLREMRGEPPLTPAFLQRSNGHIPPPPPLVPAAGNQAAVESSPRPNKRPRTQSMDLALSQINGQAASPNRPQLAVNTEVEMRTAQSAPGSSTRRESQPLAQPQQNQSAPPRTTPTSYAPPARPVPPGAQMRQNSYPPLSFPQSAPSHQTAFAPHPYATVQHYRQAANGNPIRSIPDQMQPLTVSNQPSNSHPETVFYNPIQYYPPGHAPPPGAYLPQPNQTPNQPDMNGSGPGTRQPGPAYVAAPNPAPQYRSGPTKWILVQPPTTATSTTATQATTPAQPVNQQPRPPLFDSRYPSWLNGVSNISNQEEKDMARKLFPLVYKGDEKGQVICTICDRAAVKQEYGILFYHLLTEHKTAFDTAFGIAFPKK